ncbi:hypothetical protein TNCV_807981 [Trichonephila clavipes]|nr:hypothetical protein TNCV_807981 [Trichonephila clavipes]
MVYGMNSLPSLRIGEFKEHKCAIIRAVTSSPTTSLTIHIAGGIKKTTDRRRGVVVRRLVLPWNTGELSAPLKSVGHDVPQQTSGHGRQLMAGVVELWVSNLVPLKICRLVYVKSVETKLFPLVLRDNVEKGLPIHVPSSSVDQCF